MSSLHVLVVVWPVCEMVLTRFATVRSLAGVLPPMRLQRKKLIFRTQIFIANFIYVCTYGEDSFETETFSAEFAGEGHGSGVDAVVFSKSALFSEGPSANAALVRLVSRVNSLVLFQLQGRFKSAIKGHFFV